MNKKDSKAIINQTNSLARKFAKLDGWNTVENYQFYKSQKNRGKFYWEYARVAQIEITGIDPNEILNEL